MRWDGLALLGGMLSADFVGLSGMMELGLEWTLVGGSGGVVGGMREMRANQSGCSSERRGAHWCCSQLMDPGRTWPWSVFNRSLGISSRLDTPNNARAELLDSGHCFTQDQKCDIEPAIPSLSKKHPQDSSPSSSQSPSSSPQPAASSPPSSPPSLSSSAPSHPSPSPTPPSLSAAPLYPD